MYYKIPLMPPILIDNTVCMGHYSDCLLSFSFWNMELVLPNANRLRPLTIHLGLRECLIFLCQRAKNSTQDHASPVVF